MLASPSCTMQTCLMVHGLLYIHMDSLQYRPGQVTPSSPTVTNTHQQGHIVHQTSRVLSPSRTTLVLLYTTLRC
jgi:hypothetical protein